MKRQRIYIHRYRWTVIVYYNTTARDATEILRTLDDIGIDEYSHIKAWHNLQSGERDTGMTYSNFDQRASVIVLSRTTGKAEFANTWFHEVFHCAVHIAQASGIPCDGEPIAYIGGELARDMQPIAAHLMCPTCEE